MSRPIWIRDWRADNDVKMLLMLPFVIFGTQSNKSICFACLLLLMMMRDVMRKLDFWVNWRQFFKWFFFLLIFINEKNILLPTINGNLSLHISNITKFKYNKKLFSSSFKCVNRFLINSHGNFSVCFFLKSPFLYEGIDDKNIHRIN